MEREMSHTIPSITIPAGPGCASRTTATGLDPQSPPKALKSRQLAKRRS